MKGRQEGGSQHNVTPGVNQTIFIHAVNSGFPQCVSPLECLHGDGHCLFYKSINMLLWQYCACHYKMAIRSTVNGIVLRVFKCIYNPHYLMCYSGHWI